MKLRIVNLFILAMLLVSFSPKDALALQKSYAGPMDNRVRYYVYRPDEVYIFTGHYRYQSAIYFAEGESIQTITMGDSAGWALEPQGNKLFIKPVDRDATTNMTIITNKRQYLFELYAEEAEDIRDEELAFNVYFQYPDVSSEAGVDGAFMSFEDAEEVQQTEEMADMLRPENRKNLNFNYTVSGSRLISPIQIFDDGNFTYLKFRDKNTVIPALYAVSHDGNESLINYRMQYDMLVMERVEAQLTLRNGEYVACVFNETKKNEKPIKFEQKIEYK